MNKAVTILTIITNCFIIAGVTRHWQPANFHNNFHNHKDSRTHMDAHKLKYYVELQSGRSIVMNSSLDPEEATWDAYEEACLMDDYLINITPICDV